MENELKYVPIYKSYIDAVAKLTPEDRLAIYEAIFNYGFTGIEPVFDNPYLAMGWNLVKPNLENNIKNQIKNAKNASKGGRPVKKTETITTPVVNDKKKVEEQPIQQEIVQPELNNNEKNQEEMKRIANPQNEAQIWNNELCDLEDICVETNINKEESIEGEIEKDDRTLEEVLEDLIKVKRISFLEKLEVQNKIKENVITNKEQLLEEYNKFVK
jgi:hypothetical protein